MPALRSLSLAGNPLALVPGYPAAVTAVLKVRRCRLTPG
jgi:hypothetical protein